jgi:peptidoglycan/LPS O-acetylase OafA/YrhL
VAIFFAISGFCIHHFYSDLSSVSQFYTRRFLRILPPYWFLLIIVTTIPFIGVELFNETLPVQFFTHLFSVHNFSKQTIYGIVPAWWTIAVEIQLYLLYPLVLLCMNRWGANVTLLITGSVELLLRGYHSFLIVNQYEGLPAWLIGSPLYFWFSWTLGACAAEWRNARPLLNNSPILHAGMALLFLACFFFRPINVFIFPLVALWTSVTLASNIKFPDKSAWFVLLAKVGVVSYSFYLITDTILFNSRDLFSEMVGRGAIELILLLAMFGPTYVLAKYLYAKVERPSQELGRKMYQRAPVSVASSGST